MNKKILIAVFSVLAFVVIMFSVVKTSRGGSDVPKDGVYFAQQVEFSKAGWRYQIVVNVEDGNISSVNWNAVSNLAGTLDKKTWAAMGNYGMASYASQGEWDVQAKAVESYLLKTQNVAFSKFDASGKTDAISGATITVSDFYLLVNEALAKPAISKGKYVKDGWFFTEDKDFDEQTGWKDSVLVTVVNGTIVDVLWNSTSNDPDKKSKIIEAQEGRYGMGQFATKGEWDVQAKAIEKAIVKAGDPEKISIGENGKSDAISGATITLNAVPLTIKALESVR